MANKDDYPIVKYRIVTGNGYYLVEGGEEELEKALAERRLFVSTTCFTEKDKKRFSPKYVVKVTEEYIEV